jgi:hypothetical protein
MFDFATLPYRISEGLWFTTLVNDVNPDLFPESNSDARPGTIINGQDRYFVAGTRIASRAVDKKFYSRSLQAATQHWAGVTCGAGREISTTFSTQNPPLGAIYPEFPNFDSSAFGNRATPTIDFTDQAKTYIDQLTGILLKRVTGPMDVPDGNIMDGLFSFVRDVKGNSWVNAENALTKREARKLATTNTPDSPLFLAWRGLAVASTFDQNDTVNDLNLRVYCTGANGGTLEACISIDSGGSCATDTITISCPASIEEVDAPANYPTPMFAGWGTQYKALSKRAMANQPSPAVRVSGNTVTWVSGAVQFDTDRAAGTKILIPGTAPNCPGDVCTIKSVDTPLQISIQETVQEELGGSTLAADAAIGAVTLKVKSPGSLFPGNHIRIEPGSSKTETVQVAETYVIGSTTVTLRAPLTRTHPSSVIAYWAGLDDGALSGPNPPGTPVGKGERQSVQQRSPWAIPLRDWLPEKL